MKQILLFFFLCILGIPAFGEIYTEEEVRESIHFPKEFPAKNVPVSVEDFRKKFYGTKHCVVIKQEITHNKNFLFTKISTQNGLEGELMMNWHSDSKTAHESIPNAFMKTFGDWSAIAEIYKIAKMGDYALLEENKTSMRFVRGNVAVFIRFSNENLQFDPLIIAQEIDDLLCGNAEFLPKDDPEFVQIRENYKKAEAARERERKEREARERRERRDNHVRELIETGELTSILQNESFRQKDEIAELENALENCVPAKSVPAKSVKNLGNGDTLVADSKFCQKVDLNSGDKSVAVPKSENPVPAKSVPAKSVPAEFATDANAWKKLNVRQVKEIFGSANRCFAQNADYSNLLMLDFAAEFRDKNAGGEKEFRGEIVHAQNLEDAWRFALLLRQKYANFYKIKDWPSKNLEQKFPFPPAKEIAKSTTKNAFPQLGDWNISWIGHRDSSFLVEGESAESLVIFIRGTTVVCICGRKFGESERPYCIDAISVLDFARQMDARLCGDVPAESDNEFDY